MMKGSGTHPDPLKDRKKGTPKIDTHYHIGETGGLLGVPFFGSFRGSG